jgi:hypothetical protein
VPERVKPLEEEWVLGYSPAALIDWGLTLSGKPLDGLSHEEAMTQVEYLARRGGVDTIILPRPTSGARAWPRSLAAPAAASGMSFSSRTSAV